MRDKPIVLIDLDGVCADFNGAAWDFCNLNGLIVNCEQGQERHHYLTDHIQNKNHRRLLRDHIDNTPFFRDLNPIEGAIDGVRRLAELVEIWLVSKPLEVNSTCHSDKHNWVTKHLPELSDRLILAGDKSLVNGDILLDDAPKPKWFPRADWQPVVFNQPYNCHAKSDLYDLVHFDWEDPIEYLIELAQDARNGVKL